MSYRNPKLIPTVPRVCRSHSRWRKASRSPGLEIDRQLELDRGRPGRPEKLTLRADVEVTLPIEGKVGTRQDALFPLAHVPNRDVRREPVPITQWRNLPVPYAVSAASRSGLSPNRSSVRLIIVFVAAT